MTRKHVRGSIVGFTSALAAAGAVLAPGVAAGDTIAPSTADNLRVEKVSVSSATLRWDAADDNAGWVMYEVEANALPQDLQRNAAFEPTKTFSNLKPELTYTASVVTVDGAGNRSGPVSVRFTTSVDSTAPTAPTNLHTVTSGGQVQAIAWNASTDQSTIQYMVFSGPHLIATSGTNQVTSDFLINGVCTVEPGSTHSISVQARDRFNNVSGRTGPITVTFPAQ
jgi:fibronectin type III domain protein